MKENAVVLSTHRIHRVSGTPFRVTCVSCNKRTQTNIEPIYADLDGKPWVDYYCKPCAENMGAKI